jgi:hypothetical protein
MALTAGQLTAIKAAILADPVAGRQCVHGGSA